MKRKLNIRSLFHPPTQEETGDNLPAKIALYYSIILLVCLLMGVSLYFSSTSNSRSDFWDQRLVNFQSNVSFLDHSLSTLDSYSRQLLIDSTFIRFSNMKSRDESGFYFTAYTVKNVLTSRLYSLSNLPITESHIYLTNHDYIISGSQFTEIDQFYRSYRKYRSDHYEDWLDMLVSADGSERNFDASAFTGIPNQMWLVRNIDDIMMRKIPAIIWFEWDMNQLNQLFFSQDSTPDAMVLAVNGEGALQFLLGAKDADYSLSDDLQKLLVQENTPDSYRDFHLLTQQSTHNDWKYLLVLPQDLCAQALGNYDLLFIFIIVLAILGAAWVVVLMVRQNMRPIVQLGKQLQIVQGDNALLKEEMDVQRPFLSASYLRRILSGHISSGQEFDYIMRYLHLDGDLKFLVLFAVSYSQSTQVDDSIARNEIIGESIQHFLQTDYPVYHYNSLDHACIILVPFAADSKDPLMELQTRVMKLHDHLMSEESLWFYTGVGTVCTEPFTLWESYEQARMASRYTAKHHIYLPYEVIQKEEDNVYYPVEISAKLQHFIATGNSAQVTEMFTLIHHENIEERSLPINMMNFLLSDIKNTILRARFSIAPKSKDEKMRLAQIDERINDVPTFPLYESIALSLCGFFVESAEPSDPIPEIKDYLRDNFTDPSLCLTKLSDQFHISESYLSHMFKERTGENFSVYLENLRLNEAVRRLQHMDKGAKDQGLSSLYLDLGYNNPTTFRRAFKKCFGMTPSEMRDSKPTNPRS
ncbi:MAG: helix-turn-helix transcriptional regulator [Clostridiales bacterium]|nr:helix-turn-helix transcriptional regulator [Clostridiales bacterium]